MADLCFFGEKFDGPGRLELWWIWRRFGWSADIGNERAVGLEERKNGWKCLNYWRERLGRRKIHREVSIIIDALPVANGQATNRYFLSNRQIWA